MKRRTVAVAFPIRRWLVLGVFLCCMVVLLFRAVYLQLLDNAFLKSEGDARSIRIVDIPAHRGVIFDRNGEQLAISTPVISIWATPEKVLRDTSHLPELAKLIGETTATLRKRLEKRNGQNFVYLKRHVTPATAKQVQALDIQGISTQREYKRYYPAAEIASHIIGFTDIDDQGQEGMELAYEDWLSGKIGKKRILKDRLNRVVENIEQIESAEPGRNLHLSIDKRIQYLAYRELTAAVNHHQAKGGGLVMLDVNTGEVMAMVGQPAYNPNDRENLKSHFYRNRNVTDLFEPGSTIKPFSIMSGLKSGAYKPDTPLDTTPGVMKVGRHSIRDIKDYGVIDVTQVITKSSNIGVSKIALSLPAKAYHEVLVRFGFGKKTGSAFPGEVPGVLNDYDAWSKLDLATISFGYGLSVTALQLAHAYSVLANGGISLPVSFLKVNTPVSGERVFSRELSQQVRDMLETVVSNEGTGKRAAVKGYRVMGKTGTVHKSTRGGYAEDRYLALFAGIAPASKPRFAMVIVIDEPSNKEYYGGVVAAPVFSKVMAGTFRIMNIPPDDLSTITAPIITRHEQPRSLQGVE